MTTQLSYYQELENSLHDEVDTAKKLLLTPLPDMKVELTLEQIESELLSLSALHHICAQMRSRGKTNSEIVNSIKSQYGYKVTAAQVASMVAKVLNLNYRMMPKSTELLRQQVEDQIDSVISGLYATAAAEGRTYLNPGESKIMLSALDRRIKLQGLNAAIEVKLTDATEVKQMQDDLYAKLSSIMRSPMPAFIDTGQKVKDE